MLFYKDITTHDKRTDIFGSSSEGGLTRVSVIYRSMPQVRPFNRCHEMGDNITFSDAVLTTFSVQLCSLFAIILTTYSPSNLEDLWKKDKSRLSENILNYARRTSNCSELQYTIQIYNLTLIDIKDKRMFNVH